MRYSYNTSSKETKNVLSNLKNEVANELGVDLKSNNLTSKDAGRVGGEMVKRMIEKSEHNMGMK